MTYQPSEEQLAADAAEDRLIMSGTYRDVPRGHYALPIVDDDGEDLGYRLFERKEPRVTKTGRRIGRDVFVHGGTVVVPGTDHTRVTEFLEDEREWTREFWGPRGFELYTYHRLAENADLYRATFGMVTGQCGCCGRPLTDADSKLRGIGPECKKGTLTC